MTKLLIALLLAAPAQAGDFSSSAIGTTAVPFLELGAGARGTAMAGAVTADPGRADALTVNPAGLAQIKRKMATLTHAPYLDTTHYEHAAFALPVGPGTAGVAIQHFSAGSIPETDISGAEIGHFTPSDLAVTVGFAQELPGGFSAGLAGKWIQSTIKRTAQTGAVDLGLLSPAFLGERLRLGAAVQNVGGTLKFKNEADPLPMSAKAGAAFKISQNGGVSADVTMPRGNTMSYAVGGEFVVPVSQQFINEMVIDPADRTEIDWTFAFRAGYNSRTVGDINGLTGFTFGLGTDYEGTSLDYAVAPFGDLGLTHRITIGIKL